MAPRPVDVVKDGQQLGENCCSRLLSHRFSVTVNPLAVVGVLGVYALHIRGTFCELSLERCQVAIDLRSRCLGGGGSCPRCRLANLSGLRVDASLVTDHRSFALRLGSLLAHAGEPSSPSSTISASTMSSSVAPSVAAPGVASPPAVALAASPDWYIAAPSAWLAVATFSTPDLMA